MAKVTVIGEFNISKIGKYREMISKIRSAAQEAGRFSHNRPVMPPRTTPAAQGWMDLVLSTDKDSITLRIRKENLYLDGYMIKNGNNKVWYEFNNDTGKPLIGEKDARFLDYDGTYGGLARGGAGPLVNDYSRSIILNSVAGLSKVDATSADKARHLKVIIVAVCEVSRFETLSSKFTEAMESGQDTIVNINDISEALIKGWGNLSEFMLKADAFGGEVFRLPKDNKLSQSIRSASEAATYVGLLLGSADFRQANRALPTTSTAVPAGQPLVEVLSVRLLVASTRLSGTIAVTDGLGSLTLFTGGNQAVSRGDALALNTLDRAISAAMFFEISYNLATPASLSGQDYWSIFNVTDSYSRAMMAGNNSLAVTYIIFPNAWQLTWEAKIVASGVTGNAPVNVFGTVAASYTFNGTKYETLLFSRVTGNSVQVAIGGNMPLLRLAAAAPVGVDVTVDVNLSHRLTASSSLLIVQGRGTFRVGVGNGWTGSNVLPFTGTGGGSVSVSAAYSRVSQPPN